MTAQDPFAPPPPGSPQTPSAAYGYSAPQLGPVFAYASPWRRLGAVLLNGVLLVVTLVLGWIIWTLVLWGKGTNPGKKLLGMEVVSAETGQPATFGHMFVREFGLPLVFSFVPFLPLVDALFVFSDKHQRIIDKIAKTYVVTT